MRGWCTSLSLPNVTTIIQTVLTCLTGLLIGLVGQLTGLTGLTYLSLVRSLNDKVVNGIFQVKCMLRLPKQPILTHQTEEMVAESFGNGTSCCWT